MYIKTIFILLFMLFQFDCSNLSNRNIASNNEIGINSNVSQNTPCNQPKLDDSYRQILYRQILNYFYNDKDLNHRDKYKNVGDGLVYRTETIEPQNIDQIHTSEYFEPTLKESLIKANQKTEYLLEEGYDVLGTVRSNSGDRDLSKFYETTKLKYSNTRSVVAFSNIGISENHNQGIVYVEFYGPDKKLVKMYVYLVLQKNTQNKDTDIILGTWFIDSIRIPTR